VLDKVGTWVLVRVTALHGRADQGAAGDVLRCRACGQWLDITAERVRA